jgi:hypothetical protein
MYQHPSTKGTAVPCRDLGVCSRTGCLACPSTCSLGASAAQSVGRAVPPTGPLVAPACKHTSMLARTTVLTRTRSCCPWPRSTGAQRCLWITCPTPYTGRGPRPYSYCLQMACSGCGWLAGCRGLLVPSSARAPRGEHQQARLRPLPTGALLGSCCCLLLACASRTQTQAGSGVLASTPGGVLHSIKQTCCCCCPLCAHIARRGCMHRWPHSPATTATAATGTAGDEICPQQLAAAMVVPHEAACVTPWRECVWQDRIPAHLA